MELSQDMIIDLGLDIIGYMAAGGLTLLLWSIRSKRRAREEGLEKVEQESQKQSEPAASAENPATQYISFGTTPAKPDRQTPAELSKTAKSSRPARRDRLEIIGIAREMIRAGADADRIKSVLPISDAELSLLTHTQRK